MRKASAHGLTIRTVVAAACLAVGCNAILGNEERDLVDGTSGGGSDLGGSDSGSGGTSASESGGAASGSGGQGGSSSVSGGNADSGSTTDSGSNADSGGAAGAAGAGEGGEAGDGGRSSGVGGFAGASTASGGGGSGGTGEPCACSPGISEPMDVACGNCGTATVTRLCNESCQWDEYGPPGPCMNEGVCAPNEAGFEYGHCTNGRWRDRNRTCGADCQWGDWIEGECEGDGSNCTGCACVGWCTDPDTGGTTCKWIDCSESEGRAECEEDIVAKCGAKKEPFTFLEWLPN